MNDLGVMVNVLRADFRTVAAWCLECGEWCDADVEEIGLAIKAAIDLPDHGEVAFWSAWMARYAESARASVAQLQALEREAEAWWMEEQRRAA